MAVKGKQPIKWLFHCWLKAIGQTKKIEEIKVMKFWLDATNFQETLEVARDAIAGQGVVKMKIWGDDDIGNVGFQPPPLICMMGVL
jgi:hypothetical protein